MVARGSLHGAQEHIRGARSSRGHGVASCCGLLPQCENNALRSGQIKFKEDGLWESRFTSVVVLHAESFDKFTGAAVLRTAYKSKFRSASFWWERLKELVGLSRPSPGRESVASCDQFSASRSCVSTPPRARHLAGIKSPALW